MKATVDQEGCIGCGLCCDICADVFRLNDDNLAEAYGDVTEKNLNAAREAEQSCPVSVIQVDA